MALHARHPGVLLVPTADIALMWHTHMALSGEYAAACGALFGESKPSQLWRPAFLELGPQVGPCARAHAHNAHARARACAYAPDRRKGG